MDEHLRNEVRRRAGNRCEYCRIPQDLFPYLRFPVDHIIARQHRGPTALHNLALSCPNCNATKGPNIASVDPVGGALVPLFNPRHDHWPEHFAWNGVSLTGLTPIGRATVELLAINHPDRLLLRESLQEEGAFPFDE